MNTLLTKTLTSISSTKWYSFIITTVLSMLAPLQTYIYLMILILVVDAVTSIYYQFRQNRPHYDSVFSTFMHTVESNKLRITVEKMFFYIAGIIVVYLFESILLKNIPVDGIFDVLSVTNVAAMLICSIEIYSILENISKITNNPLWLRIANIIKKKVDETN